MEMNSRTKSVISASQPTRATLNSRISLSMKKPWWTFRTMNRHSIFLSLLTILCLVGANGAEVKKRGVIMDYIGAQGFEISINSIPVHENVDFYFLLAFAIDSDETGKPQNGIFRPYWVESLTPASILQLKSVHKNVKVMMSLSGWSIYTNKGKEKVLVWYDPKDKKQWLTNAVNSITSLVQEYHLDGIDIDYETIPDDSHFAPLIGKLITTLKQSGAITTATIAPYTATGWHYAELFTSFPSVIDYVLYQFYTEIGTKPAEMVARYNDLAKSTYTYEKMIPGYMVNGIGLQGANFTKALRMIKKQGHPLNGVMIYSADRDIQNGFRLEKEFQKMF